MIAHAPRLFDQFVYKANNLLPFPISVHVFQIAREHGIRFMETSAKSNINIERAFCELAEAILDKTSGRESAENQERVIIDRRNQEKAPGYSKCCA